MASSWLSAELNPKSDLLLFIEETGCTFITVMGPIFKMFYYFKHSSYQCIVYPVLLKLQLSINEDFFKITFGNLKCGRLCGSKITRYMYLVGW